MARCWLDLSGLVCLLTCILMVGVCAGIKEDYVVDTLVVMDAPGFSSWVSRQPQSLPSAQRQEQAREKIKEYISLVIRQANLRLNTLDENNDVNWNIQLSVAGFSIGSDPLSGSVNIVTNAIAYQTALDTFQLWVVTQGYQNDYDYVILLTGYDLKGDARLAYEIKGIANIGAVCKTDGSSITVVEDRGGFQSVHFIAHEVGHSLGSKHDGESPNIACPETGRYLMAINEEEVTSANIRNPWYFSTCSKRSIFDHITNQVLVNYASCLKDSKPAAPEFQDTENVLAGQVYDIKAQCQQLYGPRSSVCSGDQFKLSDVCTAMPCLNPNSGSGGIECRLHRAAEGSSCGTGKICQMGQCVESPLAPPTQFTDCYFGDATVLIEGTYTCSQYINANPVVCYQSHIEAACCESCKNAASNSQVCPYGDRKSGCSTDLCQHIDVDGTRLEEDCCRTCNYDVIKPCVDVAQIEGMTCRERVELRGIQGCYDTEVAYHCCATCAAIRKNVTGCEYGDKTTGSTCRSLAYSKETCDPDTGYGRQCCATCDNLGGSAWTVHSSSPLLLVLVVIYALSRLVTL